MKVRLTYHTNIILHYYITHGRFEVIYYYYTNIVNTNNGLSRIWLGRIRIHTNTIVNTKNHLVSQLYEN